MSEEESEIRYECVECGAVVTFRELVGFGWKCVVCGRRVFKKLRPPIARKIKAR